MLGDDLNVNLRFESFVNSKWCKTYNIMIGYPLKFESFVNLEWCKTAFFFHLHVSAFESFGNVSIILYLHQNIGEKLYIKNYEQI